MFGELQEITDRLAADLNRSVFVEDSWFRPLATSAQLGAIDAPRVQAILRREPVQEHVRYFHECGVTRCREPFRVPANPNLDLLARLVIPVLAGDRLLARVWLIDAEPPIDDDMTLVRNAVSDMRVVLLRQQESVRQRVAMAGRWLEEVESAGASDRQAVFRRMQDSFGTADLDALRACILQIEPASAGSRAVGTAADTSPVPSGYLDSLFQHVEMRGCVGVIRGSTVLALVSDDHRTGAVARLVTAARQVAVPHGVAVTAAGFGGVLGDADGLPTSIRQAEFAARIAARVPAMDGSACWDSLGEYRMFYAYEWGPAGVAAIDPGVAALLEQGRTPFAETVLAYLERHGDVSATAAALNVHRTTLYYRLGQATRILGEELTGDARFRIHAALRFAHLSCL
ncbi:PucR family transcriptional regulator [Rhodococcus koreensis]